SPPYCGPAAVSGSGTPPRGIRCTRWSSPFTKNSVPSASAVHAPPPYSCTRERAFHGFGWISAPDELGTVTRPPCEGTDSPHQIASPTKRAASMHGADWDTSSAESGEGQEP